MDISVVVPIYKGNKYVTNILKMIRNNAIRAKGLDIELILVNDSPSVKMEIDERLIVGYEFKQVENEKNMGIQMSRINGIKASKGTYIYMLDQDDVISDNALISQYSTIKGEKAVVSNGYLELRRGNIRRLYRSYRSLSKVNDVKNYFYIDNIIKSPGLCMIKKDSIPKVWMENILSINGADDWLLWVSFLLDNNRFKINNRYIYIHKYTGENWSDDISNMTNSATEALMIANKNYLNKNMPWDVYLRRLRMIKDYYGQGVLKKIMAYLKNPDIFFRLFRFKYM